MRVVLINPAFHSHPSVHRASASSMWSWVASVCWLSKHGRVDRFPKAITRELDATPKIAKVLIAEGLWADAGNSIIVPQDVPSYSGRPMRLWKFGPLETARPKIPAALRQAVYDRDGRACLHCGATEALTLDHIHPFSRGGTDTLDNLQTLCRSCNSRKGARI